MLQLQRQFFSRDIFFFFINKYKYKKYINSRTSAIRFYFNEVNALRKTYRMIISGEIEGQK